MPKLIYHIDAIARKKNRDVLLLAFHNGITWDSAYLYGSADYQSPDHPRQKIIKWLEENEIGWEECADIANETGWQAYRDQIYIDVPFDTDNENYKKLINYIEDSGGNVKAEFPNTYFYFLTLSEAMKNAHHDEPGFWDKRAETF